MLTIRTCCKTGHIQVDQTANTRWLDDIKKHAETNASEKHKAEPRVENLESLRLAVENFEGKDDRETVRAIVPRKMP